MTQSPLDNMSPESKARFEYAMRAQAENRAARPRDMSPQDIAAEQRPGFPNPLAALAQPPANPQAPQATPLPAPAMQIPAIDPRQAAQLAGDAPPQPSPMVAGPEGVPGFTTPLSQVQGSERAPNGMMIGPEMYLGSQSRSQLLPNGQFGQPGGNGMDTRSLLIAALGGNPHSDTIPSMALAEGRGVSPEAYQRVIQSVITGPESQTQAQARLAEMARQAAHTFGLTGAGGRTPGAVENAAEQARQIGRATDIMHGPDAQNAAAFQSFVNARVQNGATIQDATREWEESGMRRPVYAQGTPLSTSAFPGSVGTAPAGTQPAQSNPLGGMAPATTTMAGGTPPPIATSPQSRLEQIYRTIQQRQSGGAAPNMARIQEGKESEGITDFVNTLGPEFIGANLPATMKFIQDRFGPKKADEWFTARSSTIGRQTPQERAIRMIQDAANAMRPGTVGNSTINPETSGAARLQAQIGMFGPNNIRALSPLDAR